MTVLTVGVGKQYSTINAAISATKDGDTVLVNAGTYVNDFSTITHNITLQSVGGLAILQATESPPNGKAILTTDADVTIDGFGFTGASVSDNNGAGIRYETGNLVVRNSVFWKNQEGLLSNADANGTILIQNSEFSQNGADDGYSHNIYVGQIKSLVIDNSYFHDAVGGHEIKSRALSTTITNSRIQENDGDGSYDIDIPNGGVAVISNNVIEKGANAPNYTTVHFGGEGTPYAGSSLTIANNTFVNDNANGFLLNNAAGAPVTFTGNSVWGYAAGHVFQSGTGGVTESGTTVLATRPTLDMTSAASAIVYNAPPATIEVPQDSSYKTFGQAGAVTASGHILTVGAHGQFQTLAAALLGSKDGDTIQVAAGTYVNDLGVVNHKVIIEGVGGIAHFVQSGIYGQAGLLTINTDVTLKNLEFSGGHGGNNGYEGGVSINGGNTTIVNSKFDDDDTGISASGGAGTTVSIYGSEIGDNGNYSRGTHNLTIGSIGSFTLVNSYVHDALTGHEISDHAYNTVIANNRIIDGPTDNTSFQIGLGQGGNAVIRNNVIEKGANSVNSNVVLIGGEGTLYSNTAVQIDGNTLVSDLANPDHPYTYFLVASAAAVAIGTVTADNNTFVGGVPGSAKAINIAATNSHVASSAVLDISSPVNPALAPVGVKIGSSVNKLTLTLGEVKGYVDAQFIVSVDGVVVGGGLVTAAEGTGTQDFTFNGSWQAGSHNINVTGTNLFSGGSDQSAISATSLTVHAIKLDSSVVTASSTLNFYQQSYSAILAGTTKLPDFDAAYYLAHNPDVAAAGINPLIHYMQSGWKEGRDPSALFSTSYYLAQNPDVTAARIDPLLHYETNGWLEGRNPSASFSLSVYHAAHPTADSTVDPLQLVIQSGDTKSYSDPLIDPTYYRTQGITSSPGTLHANVASTADDTGVAYHQSGWQQGLNPSAWFETNYYQWANPDVAAAKVDPLQHFEGTGWHEGRSANPWFSASAYDAAHPDVAKSGVNPLLAFLESSEATALPSASPYLTAEAKLFDASYYLAHNPDVLAAHIDPLFHYEQWGWHEGRDASATFDTNKYLAAYSDVKAAAIDPLAHYATYGASEGRHTFTV